MKNKVFSLCMMIFIILICATTINATNSDTQINPTTDTITQLPTVEQITPSEIADVTSTPVTSEVKKEPITSNKKITTKSSSMKTVKQEATTGSNIKSTNNKIVKENTNSNEKNNTTKNNQIKNKDVKIVKTDTKKFSIYGNVSQVLNETTGKFAGGEEDGYAVKDAKVTLYYSNDKFIKSQKTDEFGQYNMSNLAPGYYKITYEYGTYLKGEEEIRITNESVLIDHVFIPDIAFITSSAGASEGQMNKIKALKNLSDRVLFIESYALNSSYDKTDQWMLEYSNFILVDMYSQGLGFAVDARLIRESPASKNKMVAYTFGIFNDAMLQSLNWGFVGGNPHSLENTYIGSYWQAEATTNRTIINKNMENLLNYIYYLMGESKVNPTTNGNTPVMPGPQWGVSYPGYTKTVPSPSAKLINQWIHQDPGYNADGAGSLNWMVNHYNKWILKNQDPVAVLKDFENWYNKNKNIKGSFVVIISYYETNPEVKALIQEFEKQGRAAFCLYQYATTTPSMTQLLELASKNMKRGISAGSSLYGWSTSFSEMTTNSTVEAYSRMNFTILNALSGISKESYKSEYGPQSEWTYQVTIPQFEGIIGPIPISYIETNGSTVIINKSVEKHVQLVNGWANLKDKKNKDKKVTIVVYDYPPGKANIGASYLDVFTSTHDLLVKLAQSGYNIGMKIEDIPTAEELTTMMIDTGNKGGWAMGFLNTYVKENFDTLRKNHQLISKAEFMEMFNSLPKNLQLQLTKSWNTGLGNGSMIYNKSYILIPGFYFGNIFITSQPARGWDSVNDYHSDTLAPPQQYVAFYKYLYNYFKGGKNSSTDAIISMGTHGTLEWLPGRTLGLQETDWTFQLTEVPIIYPYIVSNPGEGMTAKDRSFAQVITHMTPVTTASTLYGEYSQLSDAIANYDNNKKINDTSNMQFYKEEILNITSTNSSFPPAKFQQMRDNITQYRYATEMHDIMLIDLSRSSILNLSESLNKSMNSYHNFTLKNNMSFDEFTEKMYEYVTSDTAFDEWLSTLHATIESLSGDTITYGMHTLGYIWNDTEMVQGITTIASSRTQVLQHIMELYYNLDGDYYKKVKDTGFIQQQKAIESTLQNIVTRLSADTSLAMVKTIAGEVNQKENSSFYEDLMQIKGFIDGVRDNMEWNSILGALSGGYVQPGLSGDPSLSDVIPTGRAMYASDTTKMPSKAAYASAVTSVDGLLEKYMKDLGEDTYPEMVAEVIWGTEVLRTEGISIAQFLYLLGTRPIWDQSGKVIGLEVIPLEELTITIDGVVYQRPRIDAFATIVTNNPYWIGLMYNATIMVSQLNESEDDNYVIKHLKEDDSIYRLFGLDGPKLEGTGVSDLLNNIASWQDSKDGVSYEAASVYESRISNAWTVENGKIVVKSAQKESFVYLLSNVDLVIQNLDSTWRYLDSDDYTDWFGGLLNAANVHGATPNTMLLDIRNKNNLVTSTMSQEVSKEVMGTITNPQWLQMITSSIGGWNQLAQNFENMIKTIFTTQNYAEDENGKAIHQTNRGNNTGAISAELFTNVVKTMVYSEYIIADADYKSFSVQSILGWTMTMAMNNYWKTNDNTLIRDMIQKYVNAANKYGVACCHHTCGNVNLHEWILKTGSQFGVKGLERYSQQYYAATNTGTVLGTGDSGQGAGDGPGGDGSGSSAGTEIGGENFQGFADNGVSGMQGQYQGSGSSSASGSAISQMTGDASQSGGDSSGNTDNSGNSASNGTANGSGTNDGTGSQGSSTGSSNQNGQANGGGNSTNSGDSSVGEATSSDSSSADASSGEASAASAGATSATATVMEVSAKGGQKASSQAEISLGYIIAIVVLAFIFFAGFMKRSPRDY